MKCDNCGTLIENNETICPVCLNAVQSNMPNISQDTINNQSNINSENEEIEFLELSEKKEEKVKEEEKNNPIVSKKNNKNITIIIYILIIIILIIIMLLSVLLIDMDKPRQVFKTGLDVLKSEINQSFSINKKPYQMSYSIETNLNESDEEYGELYKHINELTINFDIFNNIEENYLFFDLITTYQYKNHINLIGLLDRNLLYLTSPADFKEYYAFDTYNNIFAGVNRVSKEEILIIIDSLLTSFNSVLKSDYFTEKKSVVELDNQELNLIIDTFVINEMNYKEISRKIIKKLKRNTDFINAYAKYINIDGVDLIGKLNKLSESIEAEEYKIPEIKLSIYMNNNQKLMGFGIDLNDKLYNIFIDSDSIKIYENFDKKIINITKDAEKYLIEFSGGTVKINYKKIENPIFSKPIVEGNNVLYESLTEEEKKEISDLFFKKPVMNTFLTDFERFINSIENNIEKLIEPSKEKFKKEIEEIIDAAKDEKNRIQSLSGNNVFTNEVTIPGQKLDINKVNSIYYVKIDQSLGIKRITYMNNMYCFDSDKIQNLEYINKENISEKHFMIRTKKDSYEECKSIFSLFD